MLKRVDGLEVLGRARRGVVVKGRCEALTAELRNGVRRLLRLLRLLILAVAVIEEAGRMAARSVKACMLGVCICASRGRARGAFGTAATLLRVCRGSYPSWLETQVGMQ